MATDPASLPAPLSTKVRLIAALGVASVAFSFVRALLRVVPIAIEPLRNDPSIGFLVLYGVWVLLFAYGEGYRAFQKRFVPRVVARAYHLGEHPKWHWLLLAPWFCIGLFHATRRRKITSWILLVALALVVFGVKQIPQPWRGVIDAGVAVAMAWGLVAMVVQYLQGWSHGPPGPADLPGEDVAASEGEGLAANPPEAPSSP